MNHPPPHVSQRATNSNQSNQSKPKPPKQPKQTKANQKSFVQTVRASSHPAARKSKPCLAVADAFFAFAGVDVERRIFASINNSDTIFVRGGDFGLIVQGSAVVSARLASRSSGRKAAEAYEDRHGVK
jgi:hypothetical protein